MQQPSAIAIQSAELLLGAAFSAQEFAHACGVSLEWLVERVEAGVLLGDASSGAWRFDCVMLIRARRIAHLEFTYGADPQLAAVTADLIEEVNLLRQRIEALTHHSLTATFRPMAP